MTAASTQGQQKTYEFCSIQHSGGSECGLLITATDKGERSQDPEDGTDTVQDGRVFKTEREIHGIMTAARVSQQIKLATIVLPLQETDILNLHRQIQYWYYYYQHTRSTLSDYCCVPRTGRQDYRTRSACRWCPVCCSSSQPSHSTQLPSTIIQYIVDHRPRPPYERLRCWRPLPYKMLAEPQHQFSRLVECTTRILHDLFFLCSYFSYRLQVCRSCRGQCS